VSEEKKGFFSRLKEGLSKTRNNIVYGIDGVFNGFSNIDEDFYEELEEILIMGDIGVQATEAILERLREQVKENHIKEPADCKSFLIQNIKEQMQVQETAYVFEERQSVVLVIGVNGVGKTTSIGKLANLLRYGGKKCLLCASDTFRAAAADQLEIWAERAHAEIVRQHEGADPGAVLFDALQAAKARKIDVVLCDTAGRLHNKANLMAELAKLSKIIDRECPGAARETLLVLDATTGQNGLIQARTFKETAGLTGIVLTKLDGTAKGGIVVAISKELGVPVKLAGIGEGIDDLQPFDAESYAEAII